MRQDDVRRALPSDVVLESTAPVGAVTDVVEAAAKDGRIVVGLMRLEDGSIAVLSRAMPVHDLLRGLAARDPDLAAITQERDQLQRRLDKILRSRSYRLARRMASAKRRVAGLIHRP